MAAAGSNALKPVKPRRKETCDSRVERKRELDRLAQRATRERTKNRIAFLEQKLASLESRDRPGEITNLTKIIDGLRNDNTRLQSAMVKMRFAINETLEGMESLKGLSTSNGPPSSNESSSPRHVSISTNDTEVVETADHAHASMQQTIPLSNSTPPDMVSDTANLGHPVGAQIFQQMMPFYDIPSSDYMAYSVPTPSPFSFQMPIPTDNTPSIAQDIEKWNVSNNAFINCMDSVRNKLATNRTIDLHVPFKVAMFGWNYIGAEAQHPVWAAIKQVDQKVFGTWTSKAQRIALMYVCQTMLQYRENPTKENLTRVPQWFRPRPAQEKVQHPAVIDFLIWPGLRDRLVFEHDKYTRTGDFSAAFVKYFNFTWPFGDEQIMSIDDQGRCHVSETFLEYAYDYRNWTMREDFFKKFPEMKHDIPASPNDIDSAEHMGPFPSTTAWNEVM